jgi:NADPH-dependent ferric siderophore reductase
MLSAYLVGERTIPAEGRRHLVSLGVPKSRIAFVGYWRIGKAQA